MMQMRARRWQLVTLPALGMTAGLLCGPIQAQSTQPNAHAADAWPVQTDRPMSDTEQDALASAIRAAIEARRGTSAAQPNAAPTTQRQPAPTTEPASQPTSSSKGCGAAGPGVDLTPPPLDQPQPKLVCPTKLVAPNAWQNRPVEFNLTVNNEGQGVLAIRIKKP